MNEDLGDRVGNLGDSDAASLAESSVAFHDSLRAEMKRAQDRYEEGANSGRLPAPSFKIGDQVWLSAKNIRTVRLSKKLDHKRLGKFKVSQVVSPYAYKLDLPASTKVHPVFHVSLLEPAADNPIPGQVIVPAPPVEVEGHEKWEAVTVLDSRLFRRRPEFLVKWRGYDTATWQPAASLENASEAVGEFHHQYPTKPGPW